MSLIESAQHGAPLASEEKSLDKLEIEMEEKEHMIKDTEGTGLGSDKKKSDKEPTTEKSKKDKEKDDEGGNKTPRRPLLNIKIPQILRKRSKERPPEKEKDQEGDEEKGKTDQDKTEKELLNEDEPKDVVVALPGENEPSFVTVKDSIDKDKPSETSFLSSFSTPKWPNFRRVFSFNRSTPVTMTVDVKQDPRVESSQQPTSVTVDIPETPVLQQQSEELPSEKGEPNKEEKNGKGKSETGKILSSDNNSLLTPLIRLFRPKTTKIFQEKDLESVEVATELLDKNNKQSDDNNGLNKTEQSPVMEAHPGDPEQVDGETKISPKHENKPPSEETETMVVDVKSASGGESKEKKSKDNSPSKPIGPLLWRQRFTRLPRLKWILVGFCTLLALLAIILIVTAFRANRAIDIGTLIIDGKYVNTITSCGPIQGLVENGGFAFRSIPYALPPLGELRWKPAKTHHQLHHCWNGTYYAHNDSIPCWQFYRNGSYDGSEDCLYLNVFTPKVYYDTPLPVVVFVGGESLGGGQSTFLQPSAALARAKNVVFVSVSIRRSVLGFLALDALSRNSYPMSSGNYGLSDLLAALEWVQFNAEHFGGDRRQVTLLGHSSGATLVSALMSSHLRKPLFSQVWVSGGSPISTLISFQDAEVQNSGFMKEVNCSTIDCLYSKNPEALLEAVPYEWRGFYQDLPTKDEKKHHWLVRDGLILRDSPASNVNIQTEVPFVAGSPAEAEASAEMFSYLDWNDTSKFSAYLESKLGSFGTSLSREVSDRYFRPETTPWQQFAALLSDVRTICPLYYSTTFLANQFQKSRAYFYVVTQRKQSSIGFVADANADIAAILGVYQADTIEENKYVKNMEKLFYGFVEKGKFPDDHDVTKSIYLVDENLQKIFTYPNCDFWHQHNFYPNYSRID